MSHGHYSEMRFTKKLSRRRLQEMKYVITFCDFSENPVESLTEIRK